MNYFDYFQYITEFYPYIISYMKKNVLPLYINLQTLVLKIKCITYYIVYFICNKHIMQIKYLLKC